MAKRYQVVAECAHVTTSTTGVRSQVLLYKGAFLPDDVEPERLTFLLDGGFVAEEGDTPVAPNAAVEQDPRSGADSVTPDVLRGEKPAEDERPSSDVSEQVAAVAIDEGSIDKAAVAPGVDPEVEQKRAAARAKLPADGSAPKSSHGIDVWVEYLVGQGYDYAQVSKEQDKQVLIDLAKSRQS
ncbi:hypothetical protein [Micromonospora sp. NPDC005174]|uniref:hypothetical protein n=1 Tax=Micromonospora sp. NPDC005174 TaxID=3157018 RepID=UPI0033A17BD0